MITAHFIDVDWVLNKRIIGFRKFPHPHSAYNLSQLLFNVAKEYNIDSKIFSISLDNASENTAAIEYLKRYFRPILNGQLFHIRCVCHIINLCLQDGLSVVNIYINTLREVINFIRNSGPRRQTWKEICRNLNLPIKKLPQDVRTRWNSTCYMLSYALPYREAINQFISLELAQTHFINDNEWDLISWICDFLKSFEKNTKLFSGTYYPTTNLVFLELADTAEVFENYRTNTFVQQIIEPMEAKFNKYFKEFPTIFSLALLWILGLK